MLADLFGNKRMVVVKTISSPDRLLSTTIGFSPSGYGCCCLSVSTSSVPRFESVRFHSHGILAKNMLG